MVDTYFLKNFPKKRNPLPVAFQEIYDAHYKKNRTGATKATSLSKKMEEWLHKEVAKDLAKTKDDLETLEIGAGTFNHLEYEPYITKYDVIEPFKALYEDSYDLKRVRKIYKDISDVEKDKRYARIISIATFEHILNLPEVVAQSALLLEESGSLRVSIPNEGTFLWKLGTQITGYEFKKEYGLDYQILMKYEHVNTAKEIEQVLKYFFAEVKTSVMGLSKSIAFYRFLECKQPNIQLAKDYLKEISKNLH